MPARKALGTIVRVGLTWAGDAFGAIYEASLGSTSQGIWFQRFVPAD